jgi:hypothetical protein
MKYRPNKNKQYYEKQVKLGEVTYKRGKKKEDEYS